MACCAMGFYRSNRSWHLRLYTIAHVLLGLMVMDSSWEGILGEKPLLSVVLVLQERKEGT